MSVFLSRTPINYGESPLYVITPTYEELFEKQHELINEYCILEKEHQEISKKTNFLINEYWTGLD